MISRFARSLLVVVTILVLVTMLGMLHAPSREAYIDPWTGQLFGEGGVEEHLAVVAAAKEQAGKILQNVPVVKVNAKAAAKGGVIMPKLGNETAKAELGRATWKLMHTMTLRFPKKPNADERQALSSYFYLMSRLYPCGECATEFQQLLAKYPPQTSSRLAASQWLCGVHNEVNKRLKKPMFDCAHVDAAYDCGCGDGDEEEGEGGSKVNKGNVAKVRSGSKKGGDVVVEGGVLDEEEGTHDDLTGIDMIRGG
ncbi:hypothetical protein D9611_003633 [Ephemerocybe angulata]|uniref:Sulfhydryl oxidase n=1 Tax=Ephemerocybe angulata TaxID=980116 RepID=A0A8H5B5R8_9AGAR|nr:hypothetical protein D9611_003633 [Tulosesus angulatus]